MNKPQWICGMTSADNV